MKLKKLIFIILATLMLITLVGCKSKTPTNDEQKPTGENNESNESNDEEIPDNVEKTVINYYTWEANEEKNPIIDQFMEENKDIEVVLHVMADSTDTQTKLDIMAMGGSDIDVMQIADGQQFAKAKSGLLLNLDDFIAADGINMEENFGSYTEWAMYDGSYYCYPRHTSVGCVFYNKTMFDELGVDYPSDDWTYDEYEEKAYALTHGEGPSKTYGTFNHIRPGFWCLFAIQNESFYTADGLSNINANPFILDLQNRKKLDDDGIQKSYNEITSTGTLQNNEFFNEYCSMVMAASWMVRDMKNKTDFPYEFEVGVADFPRYDENTALKSTWGSVSALGIPATSQKAEAAWRFIRYYIENGSMSIAKNGNVPCYLPSYNDEMVEVFIEDSGLSLEDGKKFFSKDVISFAKMPIGEAMVEYNSIMQEETSLYLSGSQSLDDTINNMMSRTNEAIETERAK